MATTRLGWDVFTYGPHPRLTNFPWITGRVRAGDAYTILNELARRFNSEVEPIRRGWSWGWAYRAVRGASVISEHAAGTAVDFNAPRHPLGKSGTFTAAQVRAIQQILRDLDGSVRWGGNYSGRKDEMHFELQGGVNKLAAVARKIKGGTTTSSAPKPSTANKNRVEINRLMETNRRGVELRSHRSGGKVTATLGSEGWDLFVLYREGSWARVRRSGHQWVPWAHLREIKKAKRPTSSSNEWPNKALPVTDKHTAASDKAWRKLLSDVGYKSSNLTVNFQNWLKDLGYYKRDVDGRFRAYTVEALQQFLKDRGFYKGIIDAHTAPYRVARGPWLIRAEIAYLNDQRQYY